MKELRKQGRRIFIKWSQILLKLEETKYIFTNKIIVTNERTLNESKKKFKMIKLNHFVDSNATNLKSRHD